MIGKKLLKAIDKRFAEWITSCGYNSFEEADEHTQLVCNGIMIAIDFILDVEVETSD